LDIVSDAEFADFDERLLDLRPSFLNEPRKDLDAVESEEGMLMSEGRREYVEDCARDRVREDECKALREGKISRMCLLLSQTFELSCVIL
jgi:hypothetical protein